MPPPQVRRPLGAYRRHPQHGRCRPFSRPPEPPTRPPARMGQLLRVSGPWTYRRGGPARPARPPSARRERSNARLRRGHEHLAPMRRGVQPRARLLLPSFPPLGGAAHRGRMGLPVRRTAEFRSRELDRARGCRARPTRPRRQRGRRRAGEGLAGSARERKDRSPVRLRRRLRPRQGAARTGESTVPDPPPFAGGSLLPRRPEPRRPTRPHRTPSSPRAQDEVLRSEHLARTFRALRVRGRRLRGGEGAGLLEDAPEGPQPRRKGQPRAFAHRGRYAHPGRGRTIASGREASRAAGAVAVVAWTRRGDTRPGSHLALLRQTLRPGAYLPLPQAEHGMDDA